ncbi:divergent polysaccharide deacetylase family protein, partial [Caminibacter sp.]
YKIPLFSRNVFIDNKADINYIKTQLKKVVKIAKKRGYAIAIGHPHKTTFEALKESVNILKSVKVVYINELAKYTDR